MHVDRKASASNNTLTSYCGTNSANIKNKVIANYFWHVLFYICFWSCTLFMTGTFLYISLLLFTTVIDYQSALVISFNRIRQQLTENYSKRNFILGLLMLMLGLMLVAYKKSCWRKNISSNF